MQQGQRRQQIVGHIVKRMVVLVLLGMLYNGFLSFEWPARYASVLGRIGIAYGLAALMAVYWPKKFSMLFLAPSFSYTGQC